jgi:ABC-type sugar transport system substrate-binding protein
MKRTLALILAAAAVSASCNRGPTALAPGRPTVALVLKTLNHPYFVDMRRGAQEAADRPASLQVQAAEREIDVRSRCRLSKT